MSGIATGGTGAGTGAGAMSTSGAAGVSAMAGTGAGSGGTGVLAGAGGMSAGAMSTSGAGGELADAGAVDASTTPDAGGEMMDGTCLAGTGDFKASGPYEVATQEITIGSSGDYTIYYPDPMEEDCPHPVVAWGNGTYITGGTAYAHFHEHAAS